MLLDLLDADAGLAALRRHRKARGWSQRRLARSVPYSVGTVSMIETAKRSPSEEFARHCDEASGAVGESVGLSTLSGGIRPSSSFSGAFIETVDSWLKLFNYEL
ncbi:helix-turn-helix transcriptional regulator [Sphaerimonospora sp. CA-214678]|uniref:helix-turn-helix transcriptional regulator n=1 Tax=Sphaerimonospora sp. CA-214678 TaxID=3240029 RepID=UPI003D8F6293